MPSLAITGASGKLGGATLRALLDYDLIAPSELVICTSSDPHDSQWKPYTEKGVAIRKSNYDDVPSMEAAFAGCSKLLLVSTPKIDLDFGTPAPPYGQGREKHHINAIEAARKAGVQHIYYTSLLFADNSKAGVMRAHNRTEDYLAKLTDLKYTIIREGLYNESWPLYLGYYKPKGDDRAEVCVAGDGGISWAAIEDLGLSTAMMLIAPSSKYAGSKVALSSTGYYPTLADVAKMVAQEEHKDVALKVVSRDEHVDYYVKQKKMDAPAVEWWVKTYDALKDSECENKDQTMETLLAEKGKKPKPLIETIREMVNGS